MDVPAESYRAIGRYFYEFSRMVTALKRGLVESQISHTENSLRTAQRVELELITSEMTARPIADAFFAIPIKRSEELQVERLDLSDMDRKILKKLAAEVDAEIARRNDFAHGDWMIGWGGGTEATREPPLLIRVKARRQIPWSMTEHWAEDLDRLSDRLAVLGRLLAETSMLVLERSHPVLHLNPAFRLEELFSVHEDNLVHRDGPLVSRAGQFG